MPSLFDHLDAAAARPRDEESARPAKRGQWTDEQWRAITTVDRSLLVSAAAGSGKTAVLAERCAYLVCDAPEALRCNVDELLVVTFTNAAAAEMRVRIERALRERLSAAESADDPRLTKQLAVIDRAHVSTLHAFCTSVLRQHFNLLELDPAFTTLDEQEAMLLRNDVARELFARRYKEDAGGEFQRFVDAYGNGNDEQLIAQVLRTHDLLCSIVDRMAWIARAQARIAEAADSRVELADTEFGQELHELIRRELIGFQRRCRQAMRQLDRLGFDQYVDYLTEYHAASEHFLAVDELESIRDEILDYPHVKLPRTPGDTPEKKFAVKLVEKVRDELKEKGRLYQLARFSTADWRDGLRRIAGPAKVFLDLVTAFGEQFRAAKSELRAVDFSDLERLTLQVLAIRRRGGKLEPSPVARAYHRQFRHVLVDEYQDINQVQDAILSLVSRECLGSAPQNLFCVGDVKQSIYRFRLADPERFQQRRDRFLGGNSVRGEVVDLQANFRSRTPLLQCINALFDKLMRKDAAEIEYDESHRLVGKLEYPCTAGCFSGSPIELHLLPDRKRGPNGNAHRDPDDGQNADEDAAELDRTQREAVVVAHRIREMMAQPTQVCEKAADGQLTARPIRYRDVVILLRAMRFKADQFAEQLRLLGIPVHTDSGTGFFDSMEVRDIVALLRLLDNQRQDVPMAAVLRSPIASLPDADDCLARIRLAYPGGVPFHIAAVRYRHDHNDELAAALADVLAKIDRWRQLAHRRPLAEVLWQIYDESGYLAFCAGLADGEQRVANLIELHERARQFGTFQRQGLHRFMEFLQSLQDESDLGRPSVASEADDVVRVMSVHASKGLEFPIVFLPDLGKKHNLQDAAGSILVDRDGGLGLVVVDEERRVKYRSLASELVQDRIRRQSLAEELRVLYVAMTRAREHLVLVGTCDPEQPQRWQRSWGGHDGPLPPDAVLGGRCVLDWIGPAVATMGERGSASFELHMHDDAEIDALAKQGVGQPELSELQAHFAQLRPMKTAPVADEAATRVIDRLVRPYAYEPYTRIPAVNSVTSLTKTGRAAPSAAADPATRAIVAKFDQHLPLPRAVATDRTVSPLDIGAATHRALQYLDFAAPATADSVRQQMEQMVAKKLLADAERAAVDVDAVVWLMTTELGDILRSADRAARRELSLQFPAPPDLAAAAAPQEDPLDRVMIRGRIDVLVPADGGLVVADYKTDAVTDETLAARVELYRPQVAAYCEAIHRIAGEPIRTAYLAFLALRRLERLTI